ESAPGVRATSLPYQPLGTTSRLLSRVRAAAEPGRIVEVPHRVCRCSVVAAVAVQVRVEVVAALEGAVRIVDPLVEVTYHVEYTVLVGASGAFARAGKRSFELIEPRIFHVAAVPPHPAVLWFSVELGIEEANAAATVVVAAADLPPVA